MVNIFERIYDIITLPGPIKFEGGYDICGPPCYDGSPCPYRENTPIFHGESICNLEIRLIKFGRNGLSKNKKVGRQ